MKKVEQNLNIMGVDELYSRLIDEGYFTEEELSLITCINGYRIDVLEDCIYVRYGLRSYKNLLEEE